MQLIECEGAPRDLGLDQGRACAQLLRDVSLREGFAARLRHAWRDLAGPLPAWLRDLRRHFPHQFETLEGLACGARIPLESAARALSEGLASGAAPAAALVLGEPALLARTLPADPVVRRSRPEGCLRSVELTAPGLPCALLGVNEAGLAVTVVCGDLPPDETGAAPGALLVQDCLERFASVDVALEWCLSRPAAGPTTLLLADARGEGAGVEIADGRRNVLRVVDGVLAAGALRGREGELAKTRAAAAERGGRALARMLACASASGNGCHAVADPAARRLRVPGAWIELDSATG